MMKKMLALALLTVLGVQAGSCNNDLEGVVGTVQLSPNNVISGFPLSLSQNAGTLILNALNGCYKVQNGCLTYRDDSAASFNVSPAATGATLYFPSGFVEAVLEFDVVFNKCFKNRPVVTATLEVNTPFGENPDGTVPCPLVCGGTIVCIPGTTIPVGYFNDILLFVSNVSNTGFKAWLDVKIILNPAVPGVTPEAVLQAFITQAKALIHFQAIAGINC